MSMNGGVACSDCASVRGAGPFKGAIDFGEFDEFLRRGTLFNEIPVESPKLNVGLVERWFECVRCKAVWRLIEPDPPFAGTWEPVSS